MEKTKPMIRGTANPELQIHRQENSRVVEPVKPYQMINPLVGRPFNYSRTADKVYASSINSAPAQNDLMRRIGRARQTPEGMPPIWGSDLGHRAWDPSDLNRPSLRMGYSIWLAIQETYLYHQEHYQKKRQPAEVDNRPEFYHSRAYWVLFFYVAQAKHCAYHIISTQSVEQQISHYPDSLYRANSFAGFSEKEVAKRSHYLHWFVQLYHVMINKPWAEQEKHITAIANALRTQETELLMKHRQAPDETPRLESMTEYEQKHLMSHWAELRSWRVWEL